MSHSFDLEFIEMMVVHHEAGIAMARLAEQRAEHDSLQRFAGDMIAAQTSEIRQMEGWRQRADTEGAAPKTDKDGTGSATMPRSGRSDSMDMKKTDTEEVMRDLRTADLFDKAFLKAMIPHHQMAIDMAQPATDKAELPEIKELAHRIVRAQGKEVTQMKGWLRDWK